LAEQLRTEFVIFNGIECREEGCMRSTAAGKSFRALLMLGLTLILRPHPASGQGTTDEAAVPGTSGKVDLAAVGSLLQQLQSQVQELSAQVSALKTQQKSAQAESAELRRELDAAKSRLALLSPQSAGIPATQTATAVPAEAAPQTTIEDRLGRLEENQQLAESKIAEQSQTKVESASKYRVRMSGIVLLNMFGNRGAVDNQDVPEIATQTGPLSSEGTFGGSLRQSQIELQGFGPTLAGARTSADVQFDFAGGFQPAANGVSFGLMRLRTGTVRFDWADTSVIAGQDTLFLSPLVPTSIATLAAPALAYSGNLWSWAPQVRVEHRVTVSDNSSFLIQGGILDSLSGDRPFSEYQRGATWGENSGQPAYATRLSWTERIHGEPMTFGAGAYYGRQGWGFGRHIDGWAGTMDLNMPLGHLLEFSGEFYRGRALGGLGGGIGQNALWSTSLLDPATEVSGLNSMGGWAQLKYKVTPKFQLNGAFGVDNPFASDLRNYGANQTTYYPSPLSKNQMTLANFLYQPRSDIVFSVEYRRLKTFVLDSNANTANVINLSVGYIF
jgi:regulator of replication initiation timing